MKIEIESTYLLTDIEGVSVRLWEGITEGGIKCKVFVHRLAVHNNEDASEFEHELQEQAHPDSVVSLRQIL